MVVDLGDDLFSGRSRILIIYAGASEKWIDIAKPQTETVRVSGGYDHYPYYSDYGSYESEVEHRFDGTHIYATGEHDKIGALYTVKGMERCFITGKPQTTTIPDLPLTM